MSKNKESEIDWFLNRLFRAGLMFVKRVRTGTGTSGAIYLPRHLIGKTVRVIIIPLHADEEYLIDPKKLHEKVKADINGIEMDLMRKEIEKLKKQVQTQNPDLPASETPQETEGSDRFKIDVDKKQ